MFLEKSHPYENVLTLLLYDLKHYFNHSKILVLVNLSNKGFFEVKL